MPDTVEGRKEMAATFWDSRNHIGLVLSDGARAHWFSKDSLNGERTPPMLPRTNSTESTASMVPTNDDTEATPDTTAYHEDTDVIRIDAPDLFIDDFGRASPWGRRVKKSPPTTIARALPARRWPNPLSTVPWPPPH